MICNIVKIILIFHVYLIMTDNNLIAAADWQCGSSDFSRKLSAFVVMPCAIDTVNDCCREHDRCYAGDIVRFDRDQCDEAFCDCLRVNVDADDGWYCRWIARPLHCSAVRLFGSISYEEPIERYVVDMKEVMENKENNTVDNLIQSRIRFRRLRRDNTTIHDVLLIT